MRHGEAFLDRLDRFVAGLEGRAEANVALSLEALIADFGEVLPPGLELPRRDPVALTCGFDGVAAGQHMQDDLSDLLWGSAMQIDRLDATGKETR